MSDLRLLQKPKILDILTDVALDTEGLLPGQTPLRDENLSKGGRKTSRFKDTIQGFKIDWDAWEKAPQERKNFYYVAPEDVRGVIRKQYQNYITTPSKFQINPEGTLNDILKTFDKQHPENKAKKLKEKNIDVDTPIKDLGSKFDLSMLNPFAVKEAEASEEAKPTLRLLYGTPKRQVSEQPDLSKESLKESAEVSLETQLDALKSIPQALIAAGKFKTTPKDQEAMRKVATLPLVTLVRIPSAIQAFVFPLKGKGRIESAIQAFLRPEALPAGYSGGEIAKKINPKLWPAAGALGTALDIISYQIGTGNITKQLWQGYKASKLRGASQELDKIVNQMAEPTVKALDAQKFFPSEWNMADKIGRTKVWIRHNLETNPQVGDALMGRSQPFLKPLMGEAGMAELPGKIPPEQVAKGLVPAATSEIKNIIPSSVNPPTPTITKPEIVQPVATVEGKITPDPTKMSKEEWVASQPIVYHQSQSKEPITKFKQSGEKGYKKAYYSQAGEGIYFSPNKDIVQSKYGKEGGQLVEAVLQPKKTLDLGDKDAMYFDGRIVNRGDIVIENFKRMQQGLEEIPEPDIILETITPKAKKWLLKEGYDSVTGMKGEMWSAPETVVLDPSIIKTRQQLEAEWEAAQKGKTPPIKPPEKPPTITGGEEWDDDFKAEVSKLSPEDKADYELFMKDYQESTLSLGDAVKKLGGIKPYKFGKELEEHKGIPQDLRNKDGMTLDDMATELSSFGFQFDDGEDLRQALLSIGKKKKITISPETREFLKNQRELLKKNKALIFKTERLLSRILPKSQVKSLVRKTTGQVKPVGELIKEHFALKRSLQRQEQVARKASISTKRETKEILKLIERTKEAEIESMGYEERAQLQALKGELKKTRTLEGLRELYGRIQQTKALGKQKYQETIEAKKEKFELDKEVLLSTIKISNQVRTSLKQKKQGNIQTYAISVLRPQRIFDKIDGGQNFEGPWTEHFYNQVNKAQDQELRQIDDRKEPMIAFIKSQGLSMSDFGRVHVVDGIKMSVDEIMSLYTAMMNNEKMIAVIYGNELPLETIQKAIKTLTPQEKAVADKIVQDYENNWGRLRKAFIEYTDGKHDLGKVSGYTPLRRTMRGNEPTEQELANELLERQNLKRAFAERGFTKERIYISQEHQTPIRLGELSIWMEQTAKQEHFISHGVLVKELQALLADKDIRNALINGKGLGPNLYDEVRDWTNRVANPSVYKAFTQIEKTARAMRGNVAIAYLAYNLVTLMKQFPSWLLFLEDVGPVDLVSGLYELTTNYKGSLDLIHKLSPQLKHRAIERELEELKRSDYAKYEKILKVVGETGMRGIYLIDRIATHSGWLAVYNKSLRDGLSQEEAAQKAEISVVRTQPAADPKDLAGIYASNEFLNWFTQFSNQLNQIYNMITYDIPMKARTSHFNDAFRAGIAIILSQYLIWVMSHGRIHGKKDRPFLEGFLSILPIIGPMILSSYKGFGGLNIPSMAGAQAAAEAGAKLLQGKPGKAVPKLMEAGAAGFGIPYNQLKRTLNGIRDMQSGETTDFRRLIWSKYVLDEKNKKKKSKKFKTINNTFGGKNRLRLLLK